MLFRSAACIAGFLIAAWAAEWPQWRGPGRDGFAPSFTEPKAWPEKLVQRWKVSVGEGHASPVVAGDRIYVHTRQGEREVVSCLRPENAQTIWQQAYDAPYTMNSAATRHGKGVKSTPVVEANRLYTLGISGILSCFDTQAGKLQWRKEFGAAEFGTAMSPVVDHGLLIAYVGSGGRGALTAFDTQTGAERWSWKNDGPGYASPIVVELAGTRQVVTQSQRKIISVSATSGELLWQIPFTTAYDQNAVTPVLYRETLIFSGLGNGVMGVKVSKSGSNWTTQTVWQTKDASMYMSSPVLSGELLFGFSHLKRGQFFCLDPRTGSMLWTSDARRGDNAAVVTTGYDVLFLTDDAQLTVVRAIGKAFEPVRKYTVADSPTWAHPVLFKAGILIKDAGSLALWGMP